MATLGRRESGDGSGNNPSAKRSEQLRLLGLDSDNTSHQQNQGSSSRFLNQIGPKEAYSGSAGLLQAQK